MKKLSFALVFSLCSAAGFLQAASETVLRVGDSMETVLDILGQPQGTIETTGKRVMFFDRGEVVLQGGKVVKVGIMSPENHALNLARKAEAREEALKEAEYRKRQRVERGIIQKNAKLSNPLFLSSSAESKLRYWNRFKRAYPEVDISGEMKKVLADYDSELKTLEQTRRIAESEERARIADDRARRRGGGGYPYYSFLGGHGGSIFGAGSHQDGHSFDNPESDAVSSFAQNVESASSPHIARLQTMHDIVGRQHEILAEAQAATSFHSLGHFVSSPHHHNVATDPHLRSFDHGGTFISPHLGSGPPHLHSFNRGGFPSRTRFRTTATPPNHYPTFFAASLNRF